MSSRLARFFLQRWCQIYPWRTGGERDSNRIRTLLQNSLSPRKRCYSFCKKQKIWIPILIRHISKSFQEIYKELENEGYYPTKDGNIDHWYKNGILFFDASSLPLSLTEKIIDFLNEKKDIIWLFLNEEKEIREVLSNISNTPSSTSVFFNDPLSKSFSGCNVFKKIDKILKSQGEDTISW